MLDMNPIIRPRPQILLVLLVVLFTPRQKVYHDVQVWKGSKAKKEQLENEMSWNKLARFHFSPDNYPRQFEISTI